MTTLRAAFEEFNPAAFPSIRAFCRSVSTGSVRQAITEFKNIAEQESARRRRELWDSRLRELEDLFGGGTDEEDEDKALSILLSAESSEELIFYIKAITWSELDDELDEPDLDAIASHLSGLLDRETYLVTLLLRQYVGEPETLRSMRREDITNLVAALPALRRQDLANDALTKRDALLNGLALMALRGQPTYIRQFREVLDFIQTTGQHRPNELLQLSWEVYYTEQICSQLERGEYRLLLGNLIDLVNPALVTAQRIAFLDMLRRLEREFVAMEALINAIGSERQKNDVRIYMDRRRLFMDNSPQLPQPPNAIQQAIQSILNVINGATGGFQDLVAAVQSIVQTITDFSVPDLLDSQGDDKAVNVTNQLDESSLGCLPSKYKLALINAVLKGVAEDEEEQATLRILKASKNRPSVAEFLQLVAGETWEKLDSNIDGQKHDSLVALFNF
jgi:hypothetical protein